MSNDKDFLKIACKAIEDKFGTDISVLDIRNLTVIADYFIIATGKNSSQIKAMADEISNKLLQAGLTQKHIEGYGSAYWVLIDFGIIIVHIFDKENRDFYNLERVWGDAVPIPVTDILSE